jgi:integrase
MAGKQAKILSGANIDDLLLYAETTRQSARNRAMVLLSAKAGLRAGEIAHLTWEMVTDPTGAVGTTIELPDHAAKKGSGRKVPLHGDLRRALTELRAVTHGTGPVIASERGSPMTPLSVVIWFANAYRLIGLDGCSSHSGRRTFSPMRPGSCIKPAGPCATCSCWLAIGRFKQRSGTLTATPTPSASSCR